MGESGKQCNLFNMENSPNKGKSLAVKEKI